MIRNRCLALGLLLGAALLGGCATTRSELRISEPAPAQARASSPDRPVAVIRSVRDERVFEQAPDEPSTPSLGFEGADKATAEAKLRAIGRKRNTFGKALGDVFLQDGQTVESVVRENLAAGLRDAGYEVRDDAGPRTPALVVDARIKQFWAWMNPGFWAVTVNTAIATDLTLSASPNALPVNVHVKDSRQFVTDGVWLETVEKALAAYRQAAAEKLVARR